MAVDIGVVVEVSWLLTNYATVKSVLRVSMRTTVVRFYHPRFCIECVHLEACGDNKSPGGAATIVRSMQSEKPRWGCNDS